MITWSIELRDLTFGEHEVETTEGSIRRGRITKVNYANKDIHGRNCRSPQSIELNNDASDFITWDLIKRISKLS